MIVLNDKKTQIMKQLKKIEQIELIKQIVINYKDKLIDVAFWSSLVFILNVVFLIPILCEGANSLSAGMVETTWISNAPLAENSPAKLLTNAYRTRSVKSGGSAIENRTKPFDLAIQKNHYCTATAFVYRSKVDSAILGFTILIAVLHKNELFTISHEEYMKIVFEDNSTLFLKPLPKEGKAINLEGIYYSDQHFYFREKDVKKIMNNPIKKLFLVNENRNKSLALNPAENGLGKEIAKAFGSLITQSKIKYFL